MTADGASLVLFVLGLALLAVGAFATAAFVGFAVAVLLGLAESDERRDARRRNQARRVR